MIGISCALAVLMSRQTIDVRVDPRVELVTTVFRLADADEFHMEGSDSAYTRDVDKYFAPFKNHSAVEMARSIRDEIGIGFDAVPGLAVNLTDIDTLGERIPFDLPPARWDKRWPSATARAFVGELRKFVQDTHYKEFLDSERVYFAGATKSLSELLSKNDVGSWIQEFYGSKPTRDPFVIVGLLCGGGNYGMSVEFPDGALEISPIFGADTYGADGFPAFDGNSLPLVLHEFSHGYVNPLVRKDLKRLTPAATRLMSNVRMNLAANAYGSEDAVLYESFVRAAETYLTRVHLGEGLADQSMVGHRSAGFLWESDLVDALGKYGKNRRKYRTFADYLPELEKAFERVSRHPEALIARCPKVTKCDSKWETPDTVTVRVTFDRPMRTKTRGVSMKSGWTIVTPTVFAKDERSFEFTVRIGKDQSRELVLNARGAGLVSKSGYPLQPFKSLLVPPSAGLIRAVRLQRFLDAGDAGVGGGVWVDSKG